MVGLDLAKEKPRIEFSSFLLVDPYTNRKLIRTKYQNTLVIRHKKKTLNPEFNEKMCLLVDPTDLTGRLLFEVYDWDAMTDDDLIGGFSISITELLYNPANGWFRLLGPAEAEFYNIPLAYEGLIYFDIKVTCGKGFLKSYSLQFFKSFDLDTQAVPHTPLQIEVFIELHEASVSKTLNRRYLV